MKNFTNDLIAFCEFNKTKEQIEKTKSALQNKGLDEEQIKSLLAYDKPLFWQSIALENVKLLSELKQSIHYNMVWLFPLALSNFFYQNNILIGVTMLIFAPIIGMFFAHINHMNDIHKLLMNNCIQYKEFQTIFQEQTVLKKSFINNPHKAKIKTL